MIKELRFYGLTALGLVLFPFVIHPIGGYPGLATQILIVSLATMGLNLVLGYAGLLSYGQAMFYGIGSYVALLVVSKFFPQVHDMWLALVLAVACVTLIAALVGSLVVRLYGIYFALLTLAFAQMFYFIIFQSRDLTGGDDGLQGITAPTIWLGAPVDLTGTFPSFDLGPFGNLSDVHYWYAFTAVIALLALGFVRTLVRSQFGEVLAAIRENEERSTFIGFDPAAYKFAAFVLAGALTGLAGALKGLYETSTSPATLNIDTSGSFVIYAVVGGVKTLFGPVFGTGIIMYLENVLSAKFDAWRLIEGLIFVGVVVFLPGGLLGSWKSRNVSRRALASAVRTTPPGESPSTPTEALP